MINITKLDMIVSTSGIALNILGAYFAVIGFFKSDNKSLFGQASTYWVYNSELYKSLVEQRDNAKFGFFLIFIGSIFQFIEPVIPSVEVNISKQTSFIAILILTIISALIFNFLIKTISNHNTNIKLVPMEYLNYIELLKQINQEPNEQSKIIKIQHKTSSINQLAMYLKISSKGNVNFEDDVISKVKKYMERKKLTI